MRICLLVAGGLLRCLRNDDDYEPPIPSSGTIPARQRIDYLKTLGGGWRIR